MAEHPALKNMVELNKLVRKADEKTCTELLNAEKKGLRRAGVLLRVHARLNRVRADRERDELRAVAIVRPSGRPAQAT